MVALTTGLVPSRDATLFYTLSPRAFPRAPELELDHEDFRCRRF